MSLEIIPFWKHEELFEELSVNGIRLLLLSTREEKNIDAIVVSLIKDLNITNAVCFSSFLNIIYQTQEIK